MQECSLLVNLYCHSHFCLLALSINIGGIGLSSHVSTTLLLMDILDMYIGEPITLN